jgi:DNA-binding XRE family transcriptional regulator
MKTQNVTPTFLLDAQGRRSHAILTYEDWELLMARPVQPDALDLKTLARLERDHLENPGEFEETPVLNPIRKARLAAKIRQEDLAAVLKISQPALSKLEREGHNPRASTLDRALAGIKMLKN